MDVKGLGPLRDVAPRCALILFALATGCEALKVIVGDLSKPSASLAGVRLEKLTVHSATLLFDVEVSNPYDIDLPLSKLEYTLASNGATFLTGMADVAGVVPARASRAVPVPAEVSFAEVLKVLDGVKPGAVVPYAASLVVSLAIPEGKSLSLPIRKSGELPIPAVPIVSLEGVQWEGLSLEKATALLKVRVVNQNEFPVSLSKLSYGLTLGTARVADSSLEQAASLTAGGESTLEVRTSFAPKDLGLAAFAMLSGAGASYKLGGVLNVTTPFGPIDLPYDRSGQTELKQ